MNEAIIQFIRFASVGITTTAINYFTFYIAVIFYSINHLISAFIGYSLGTILGFLVNRHWSFKNSRIEDFAFTKYLFIYGFNLGITFTLLEILVSILFLLPQYAYMICIIVSTIMNFSLVKLLD